MDAGLLTLIAGRSTPPLIDAANADDSDAAASNDIFRSVVAQMNAQTGANVDPAEAVRIANSSETEKLQLLASLSVNTQAGSLDLLTLSPEQQDMLAQIEAALLQTSQTTDLQAIDALEMVTRWLPEALQAVDIAAAEQAALQVSDDTADALALNALGSDAPLTLVQPLTSEELQATVDLAQWIQQLKAQAESQPQDGAALVGSALIPTPPLQQGSWHLQWQTSAVAGQNIRSVDPLAAADAPQSSLAQAIAADDLSLLSDAELAKLDALVDKIAQQAANGSDALKQFGALLDEQLSDLRLQSAASQHESAQPSVLSVSHSSQQTRALDESLQLRSSTPAYFQGSAQQGSAADQVKVSISQALNSGMDRLSIQLDPADLGRVDVRIDVGADGRAQLLVQADNRETLDLLQRDARSLERALQEAGIQADLRDMAFNLRQGQDQSGSNEGGARTANSRRLAGEDENLLAAAQNDNDALMGSYTLSIAQGLNIQV